MTNTLKTSVYLIIHERIINHTLAEFIRNLNYKVFILDSISALLDRLENEGVLKALLIIEENILKGIDKKIIRKITKQLTQLNVIVITGSRPEMSINEATDNRIYGFLHKPISLLELELILIRMSDTSAER